MGEDHEFLRAAIQADPTSVVSAIHQLCVAFNSGTIDSGDIPAFFSWMAEFAESSQMLREKIRSDIHSADMEYHMAQSTRNCDRLAHALALELPSHYFDICRNILAGTSGCVVIAGAGFSYDSLAPLQKETKLLVCHALQHIGESNPSELHDNNEPEAWQRLGQDGWQEFQQLTSELLRIKEPREQHRILAQLFRDSIVKHIVSFNWDDLIERAYLDMYGEDIPVVANPGTTSDHALWKLHGDVASPDERWVLPYENGRVFDELVSQLNEDVLVAFVIGYSEQEPVVREKLLLPLSDRGSLVRIGPALPPEPPDTFSDDALSALRKLKAGFDAVAESHPPA